MMAQYYHSIVVEQDAREALENVGMGHRFDHIPSHLSGGEQQRVCIARALINDPKILLADEPTGNLDQKNGKIVLDLIKRLNDEGHTVVLVTHNPDISKKGNRIIELVDGKVTKVNVKNS
jgi:putative ABC transport system ATP-binding protein